MSAALWETNSKDLITIKCICCRFCICLNSSTCAVITEVIPLPTHWWQLTSSNICLCHHRCAMATFMVKDSSTWEILHPHYNVPWPDSTSTATTAMRQMTLTISASLNTAPILKMWEQGWALCAVQSRLCFQHSVILLGDPWLSWSHSIPFFCNIECTPQSQQTYARD